MHDDDCKSDCDLAQTTLREVAGIREAVDDMREEMKKAFPGGDHDGHRRYHDLIIEREAQRVKLRQAIIEKTLSGLVWMVLCTLGVAVWHYFINVVSRGNIR